MGDVTYSRPWMLGVLAVHVAAMATTFGALLAVAFGASAWTLIAIPVVWIVAVAAIVGLWSFFNAKSDFDRGLQPRFVVTVSTTAQLRVYDKFLILRETRRSVRTARIAYRDVLEVDAGRFLRSFLPFARSLRLSFIDPEIGDRTICLPTPEAERISAFIAAAMAKASKAAAEQPTDGANVSRRTASSSGTTPCAASDGTA